MELELITVNEINDPYEPSETIAICTSLEEAKKLFPEELYETIHEESYYDNYVSKNVHTNEITKDYLPKTPFIEKVKTNTILR